MNFKINHQIIDSLVLFGIFLLWNFCQPLMSDDFGRAMADALSKHNLIALVINDFKTWTGRSTAQALVYILFSKSYLTYLIPLINVLNSIFLVMIFKLLYKMVCQDNYKSFKFWVLVVLYISFFTAALGNFSQDFLWKTVAIQYAWGFLLLLVIIWQFYLKLHNNRQTRTWEMLFYTIVGVFIGFYNEIYIAFVVAIYLSMILIWYLFRQPWHKLLQARYIIFFLATLISGVISVMAPGNFMRRQTYLIDNNIDIHAHGFIIKAFMTYVQFFRYGYHVILAIILVWIGVWTYRRRKILPQSFIMTISFLIILLNLNILSFIEIAYYSPIAGRMLIFIDSIIFLIIFKFFNFQLQANLQNINVKKWKYLFFGFSVILLAYISGAYLSLHQYSSQRQHIVEYNKKIGNRNLIVPEYCVSRILKYPVYFDDITSDKRASNNGSYAGTYNLNSIAKAKCD